MSWDYGQDPIDLQFNSLDNYKWSGNFPAEEFHPTSLLSQLKTENFTYQLKKHNVQLPEKGEDCAKTLGSTPGESWWGLVLRRGILGVQV